MKYTLLAILFIPIIYQAIKSKKWYLFLFFTLYPILPDTFAIEISSKMPLLTGSRILLVILLIMWLYKHNAKWTVKVPITLTLFMFVNLFISIINFQYGFGEANRIFRLVVEQYMLVMIIKDLITDKAEFLTCIDYMIYGCVALAIMGILQTTINLDVTTVFDITQARIDGAIENRMNMVRAYGTSNAITFGCYCAFMTPIILYRYELTKRNKYIIACGITLCALLFSMTRSAMMVLGVVIVVMLILRNRKFLKHYLKYMLLVFITFLVIFIAKSSLINSVVEVVKACLNVLGANYELSSGFGANASDASYSRNVQWTAVYYMIQEGKIFFGYGYNAFIRGKLYYLFRQFGVWTSATALDVGFVGIATESGLFGLATYILLLICIFMKAFRNRKYEKGFNFNQLTLYMVFMCILMNIATSFANDKLVWLYIALFYTNSQWSKKHVKYCIYKEPSNEKCDNSSCTQAM